VRPFVNRTLLVGNLCIGMFVAISGGTQDVTNGEEKCYLPLERYCTQYSSCPMHAESVARLQKTGSQGRCVSEAVGTCGDLFFTRTTGLYGATTMFFEVSGPTVAVKTESDAFTLGTPCPNWRHYGRRLSCVLEVTWDYCRRDK